MKKIYIQPEMAVVRLQHHNIICTSPGGYDNQKLGMRGGSGNQVNDEGSVWTKESGNIWDEEW